MSADENAVRALVEKMKTRLETLDFYVASSNDQPSWIKSCKTTMEACVTRLNELLPGPEGRPLDVQRLEKVARCCGLRFDCDSSTTPTPTSCYISCDNFFLEVEITGQGLVSEVKLGHGGAQPQLQPVLRQLLATGSYAAFCRHLRGLVAIYDLPGPKEDRTSVYNSLFAVEEDLAAYSKTVQKSDDLSVTVMRHPLGAIQQRECGKLMQLTFFASPSEFLDAGATDLSSVGDMGISGRIAIATTLGNHMLPSKPVHSVDGNMQHVAFAELNSTNSISVPCAFVFVLSESIAAPSSVAHIVLETTKMQDTVLTPSGPLHNLLHRDMVARSSATQGLSRSGAHRHDVVMPSGVLSFFIGVGKKQLSSTENAVQLQEIHFTHPEQLVKVIQLLRRQLVYNSLIKSCFLPSDESISLHSSMQIVDVEGDGVSALRVTFEHPASKNLACVAISVELGGSVSAELLLAEGDTATCSNDVTTKIATRCLSLPVLVYTLRKRLSPE